VQHFAVVISPNPYQTTTRDESLNVIRGFLLECHSGGTLELRLKNMDLVNFPWRRWPLQIGNGLLALHQESIPHMDLKPSNTVIDCDGNAVLIDVSGAGVTYEWVAPELRHEDSLSFPLDARKLNDIWAYGMLLLAIARSVDGSQDVNLLLEVAKDTATERPEFRIGLVDAISKLEQLNSETSHVP
jgi:serine/threonine protein kinase